MNNDHNNTETVQILERNFITSAKNFQEELSNELPNDWRPNLRKLGNTRKI